MVEEDEERVKDEREKERLGKRNLGGSIEGGRRREGSGEEEEGGGVGGDREWCQRRCRRLWGRPELWYDWRSLTPQCCQRVTTLRQCRLSDLNPRPKMSRYNAETSNPLA